MPGFSIAAILRNWRAETPDAPAIHENDRLLSWRQLHDRSAQVAAALSADGIGNQDQVAFLGKNSSASFELLFGGAMLNAVHLPLNWRLVAPEVAAILNDCDARILFVDADYLPVVRDMADLIRIRRIIVIGLGQHGYEDYEAWLGRHAPHDPKIPSNDDDVALQLYTSGTTGLPKGVMLTNRNIAGFIRSGPEFGFERDSVNLIAMPLFHIGGTGWALVGMLQGAASVLLRDFDRERALAVMPRHRVTHALLVPAALRLLVEAQGIEAVDFSSLKTIMYGASPISDELLATCLRIFGCDFYQTYGMTETSGAITLLGPGDHQDSNRRDRLRSAGKPRGDVELRICDSGGNQAEEGCVGEIQVRSAQIMAGYWRKPDETAKAISDDGWLKTGDAGFIKEGYLYLFDRVKDMILSGGENIYPAEIENVLMSHSGVADVAVIGVPSEAWGEEVKAIVVRSAETGVTSDELVAFARTRLAGYKVPKSVDFTEALPRNPSGKLLKKELRALYWQGRERPIG